jgi:tetratricopeptide (TPR) repeat protein
MSSATLDRSGLIEKAASLVQRGDLNGALKQYVRLFEDSPSDWNVANTLGDLYVRLGKSDDAVAHFISLAEQLALDGFTAKARALYRKILRIQPTNAAALQRVDELDRRGQSASPFLRRVLETARVAREAQPQDPETLAPPTAEDTVAMTRVGDPAPPTAHVDPWNPYTPSPVAEPAPTKSPAPPLFAPEPVATEPAVCEPPLVDEFGETEAIADAAAQRHDFSAATAVIERFLATRPHHTRALEKLIEIGVDGRRDSDLPWAQARLAEACLEVGRYQQAQDIAIDLIFREPGSTRNQELLERVTSAAREHCQSLRREPPVELELDEPAGPAQIASPAPPAPEPPIATHIAAATPPPVPPPVPTSADDADLPADLREWSDSAQAFDDIRTVLIEEAAAAAEERLSEAQRLIESADTDHAVRALEEAMCAPHLRAAAGARLANVYRDSGAPIEALACLEWVAEMPPPDEESGHELAYQLALTLEALGQQAQALGVYRELLAEVGPAYRDIAARTGRLSAA